MNNPENSEHLITWPAFTQELHAPYPTPEHFGDSLPYAPRHSGHIPPLADKWVLASNLHKSARRGLVEQAATSAEALFLCDPDYFFRRLPILALEDISLGNLNACAEVLMLCRHLPIRRKFEGVALAGYMGERLASGSKSRSVCDLLSLVNAQHGPDAVEAELSALGGNTAIDLACSRDAPLRNRAVAFLKLDRLPIRNGDERGETLRRVCKQLSLPAVVTGVVIKGNATYGLNALLPLVFELMAKGQLRHAETDVIPTSGSLDGPILLAAIDQYTRMGKRALRLWQATPELANFLGLNGLKADAQKIIEMSVFHIESALLNRRITNDCLESLLVETELAEMSALGLNQESATQLKNLMRVHYADLNNIRRDLWKK